MVVGLLIFYRLKRVCQVHESFGVTGCGSCNMAYGVLEARDSICSGGDHATDVFDGSSIVGTLLESA